MAQPGRGGAAMPGEREADRQWLPAAIDLSRRGPPSRSAFSVGALLVASSGEVIATGYSREADPKDHAEEVALRRAAGAGVTDLTAATLYSSLEPCLRRVSRPDSCPALVTPPAVRRVLIPCRQPPLFL